MRFASGEYTKVCAFNNVEFAPAARINRSSDTQIFGLVLED
jgi:hypothetical protein